MEDGQKIDRMKTEPKGSPRFIWIEAFVAVCDHGSFAAASRKLGVGESDIRSYVRKLEKWLNKILFYRKPSIKISLDGRKFLPQAKEIIMILYDAKYCFGYSDLAVIQERDPEELVGALVKNTIMDEKYYTID